MAAQPIYDVSFAGATITIDGVTIEDFMDDSSPIDVQDTETCNIEWSCNGKFLRTIKPSAVLLSVTVIPGSGSDSGLRGIWQARFNNGGLVSLEEADRAISCNISLPNGRGSYHLYNGTCVSGAAAATANGNGKMGGNTYTFAFEGCD